METNNKFQFSFSTYEAYKKIKKNDPLKLLFDSIDWSFIDPLIKDRYAGEKDLIYSPVALFKAQFLLYLGEVNSNRGLAEALRFNTKYCVICGFHHFLKTPSHSTFSVFRKKVGMDLFEKIMQRIVAQSVPVILKKFPDTFSQYIHMSSISKDGKILKCNCKGKCKINQDDLENRKDLKGKNFAANGYQVKLFIQKETGKPFAAEMKPK